MAAIPVVVVVYSARGTTHTRDTSTRVGAR